MKSLLVLKDGKKVLYVEPESDVESIALKAWFDDYEKGESTIIFDWSLTEQGYMFVRMPTGAEMIRELEGGRHV